MGDDPLTEVNTAATATEMKAEGTTPYVITGRTERERGGEREIEESECERERERESRRKGSDGGSKGW